MSSREKEKRKEQEVEANSPQKLPYPKSVMFIIGNEFCERFSYYGMKSILGLYLHNKLHYGEESATVIYHMFSMACYFTPIFGAMISDMWLGKFKTIMYISMIYILGHLLKTLAAVPTLGFAPVEASLIGLALIAIGTGGIKPCVASFGGDQFKLPEQQRQLQTFFSFFYFSINAGSLLSTLITPILREDVECFGDDTCYSLAFGIPAILMGVATVIIFLGNFVTPYVMKPPSGNVLVQTFGCIAEGIKGKLKKNPAAHWLDNAKTKYDHNLVEDVKGVLHVLVLYLPLPVFWALYDQTGSRWTFQANRMNGDLGGGVIMKPDQMQVMNPLLILFLIPLFDRIIYPLFAKVGLLVKPLQRITVGGVLVAASFVISGFLEIEMSKTYAKVPAEGESHLYAVNSLPCPVNVQIFVNGTATDMLIPEGGSSLHYEMGVGEFTTKIHVNDSCMQNTLNVRSMETKIMTKSSNVSTLLISSAEGSIRAEVLGKPEEPLKDDRSRSRVRIFQDIGETSAQNMLVFNGSKEYLVELNQEGGVQQSDYHKMDFGSYRVTLGESDLGEVVMGQGEVLTILLAKDPVTGVLGLNHYTLTSENSINIFWLFPQYFVITVGEILFSITGIEFSYSQAPDSMKAVVQAAWLLTTAFGNVIVVIVAESSLLDRASECFMFAILMVVDMVLFAFLAYRYTPREEKKDIALEATGVSNNNFNADE